MKKLLKPLSQIDIKKDISQYAHNVVLTTIRRRFNVMDVVWTSKRRRVLTGMTCFLRNKLKTFKSA